MLFSEICSVFKFFFDNNGLSDDIYEDKKNDIMNALKHLNVCLIRGILDEEKKQIIRIQKDGKVANDIVSRGLQQMHYFIKKLKFEKSMWSKPFYFINFILYGSIQRSKRWLPPKKKYKVIKTQHISAYADSLLFSFEETEHIIMEKLESIEKINKIENEFKQKIKEYEYVIKNMHKEDFCAKHYHYIRLLMNKKKLQPPVLDL